MSGSVPPQVGGQQSADPQPQQPGNPPAPAGAPQAAPQQMAPQKPAYSFNSLEEAVAFAEQQRAYAEAQNRLKREANAEARQANDEVKALRQEVQQLTALQRLAAQKAIAADVQLVAKTMGFKHPDFVYNAIAGQLQYDQATGQPTNVQAVLDTLKARIPELLEAQQQPGTPPAPGQPGPTQPQPGQPGAQGQPAPQVPGQQPPQGQPQPGVGVLNAPRSATTPPDGGLTWDIINANIRNPAWVAANEKAIEGFMANPENHKTRQR